MCGTKECVVVCGDGGLVVKGRRGSYEGVLVSAVWG